MPESWTWVAHFVTHKRDPIVARIRLDLSYYGACVCPGHDGGLHLHRVTNVCKREVRRRTTYSLLTVGDVVIHVALPGILLAPGVFTRSNEIGRAPRLNSSHVS